MLKFLKFSNKKEEHNGVMQLLTLNHRERLIRMSCYRNIIDDYAV